MSNKITLTYENRKYNVYINDTVIYTDSDMESAFIKFNQAIKNNASVKNNSWNDIESSIKNYKFNSLEVNSEFKTISFGKMKYFYNTDKIFYIENNSMISLGGGYSLFEFVLDKINKKELIDEVSFLELCKIAMINEAIFRVYEDTIIILTPKFNYGSVEFNFTTKTINKGTSREKSSFEEFKNYVLEVIK